MDQTAHTKGKDDALHCAIEKSEKPRFAGRLRCQLRQQQTTLPDRILEACGMMFAQVRELVHAADENVERDHLLPQFALLVYGLPHSKFVERQRYYRDESSRRRLRRQVANNLMVIVHR